MSFSNLISALAVIVSIQQLNLSQRRLDLEKAKLDAIQRESTGG